VADYFNSLDLNRPVHEVADGKGGFDIVSTERIDLAPSAGRLHLLLVSSMPKGEVVANMHSYRDELIKWGFKLMAASALLAYALAEINITPFLTTITNLTRYAQGEDKTLKLPRTRLKELRALTINIEGALSRAKYSAEKEATALAKYEVMFNSIADGLITTDINGTIITVNPALRRLFGYGPVELKGKNITILMPDRFISAHAKAMNLYQQNQHSGIVIESADLFGKRKNGTEFPVELSVTGQRTGSSFLFTGIIKDISERKKKEEDLRDTLSALTQSNEELDEFAYVVSHDLREPMRGMQMHAQKLSCYANNLPHDAQRRMEHINGLAEKMQSQITDLLYFSRLGRTELALESIDTKRFVQSIIESLDMYLVENNAEVKINDPLPVIAADKPRLNSIFNNLIVNGIKYNKSKQKNIEITFHRQLEAQNGYVNDVFAIADNGIGIDEQFHQDVFRIFKRLNAEAEFGGGTGAGLTFVKKSVEKHGGCIWLKSTPGQGTTFYFTLSERSFVLDKAVDKDSCVA